MKTLSELQRLIINWANDRNLIHIGNAPKQKLKLIEEAGELASAILKNDIDKQKDAIGDCFVVLVILSAQLGQTNNFEFIEGNEVDYFSFLIQDMIGAANSVFLNNSMDCLNDIAQILNLDLTECANIAYNEIKERKGQTINGTFIKD